MRSDITQNISLNLMHYVIELTDNDIHTSQNINN